MRVAAAACALAVLAAIACARTPEPPAKETSRYVRNQFFVREDAAVAKVEPALKKLGTVQTFDADGKPVK